MALQSYFADGAEIETRRAVLTAVFQTAPLTSGTIGMTEDTAAMAVIKSRVGAAVWSL